MSETMVAPLYAPIKRAPAPARGQPWGGGGGSCLTPREDSAVSQRAWRRCCARGTHTAERCQGGKVPPGAPRTFVGAAVAGKAFARWGLASSGFPFVGHLRPRPFPRGHVCPSPCSGEL